MNAPSQMKTGYGLEERIEIDVEYMNKVQAALIVLLEKSMKIAAHYATCAGRDVVTPQDMQRAMMYEAHEYFTHSDLEENIQKRYNELEEESEEEDSEEEESEESEEEEFTEAKTDDPIVVKVNEYYSSWSSWQPTEKLQQYLKRAIDSRFEEV